MKVPLQQDSSSPMLWRDCYDEKEIKENGRSRHEQGNVRGNAAA
jgi:hypothetical protein